MVSAGSPASLRTQLQPRPKLAMTHPFSTDAFSGVREFLYSASWTRSIVCYEQQMRTADRMLAGRSCDHALPRASEKLHFAAASSKMELLCFRSSFWKLHFEAGSSVLRLAASFWSF